jgi:hypothetical protein
MGEKFSGVTEGCLSSLTMRSVRKSSDILLAPELIIVPLIKPIRSVHSVEDLQAG